jgi:hypothetical protein
MTTYIGAFAVFALFGGYVLLLYRQWFEHLKALAARYDVRERRKRAARRYAIVVLLLTVPSLGVVLGSMRLLGKDHGILVVPLLVCALAPAVIWWVREVPSLRALGYGRQP